MGTSTARLELRLPAAEKAEIEEAAGLTGRTVTEYVRTAARDAARTDLARSIKVSGEVLNLIPGALELKGNERRPKGFQRTSWISLPVDE